MTVSLGQWLQMLTVAVATITGVYKAGGYMERLHTDLASVAVTDRVTNLHLSDVSQTLIDIANILRHCPGPGRRSEIDWSAQLASRGTGPLPYDPCQ